MYRRFFGLAHEPFSIAPDPRYLFMSERHREALAHLLYGVRAGGGFVLLTGAIGAGKTTVCRCFLEQIPKRCNVAYVFNPQLTVIELLQTACEEFGIALRAQAAPTIKSLIDPLNDFLLKTHAVGQNNVLIIDEAQSLSGEVLEQLRLLTNLETNERKLLQIVLIGQPELRDMLARPQLEQLAQRVIARCHLDALSEAETAQYVRHRLDVAGLAGASPFERRAMRRVHVLSGGVPRRINLLCDRALLGAYAAGQRRVDERTVIKAAREVFDTASRPRVRGPTAQVAAGAAFAVVAVLLGVLVVAGASWLSRPGADNVANAAGAAAGAASEPRDSAVMPAVAMVTAEPAELDLAREFATLPADEETAWRQLGAAWRFAAPAEADPCAAALQEQLQCFRRSAASLALIRTLDRPGILTLHDGEGGAAHALLVGLGDATATLRIDGRERRVALGALAQRWRGDFATFWRTPPGYEKTLLDGQAGQAVDWLAQQLAALDGAAPDAGTQRVDTALKARVQAFQVAHGLEPDGLAGPTTFMQLNRVSGIDEPRLSAPN